MARGAHVDFRFTEEQLMIQDVARRIGRTLPREFLANIIEPRVEEIFQAVQHVLNESGYAEQLNAGAVLCGGSTLLDGMPELAERILGMPVRRANPTGVGGLSDVVKSPAYATAVGLVKHGAQRLRDARVEQLRVRPVSVERGRFFQVAARDIKAGVVPGAHNALAREHTLDERRAVMRAGRADRMETVADARQQDSRLANRDLFHLPGPQV